MATVGHSASAANFPGSTANLGGTMNMGDDPKQAAEFQKKSTDYSKDVLKALGLSDAIDVQHALEYNDPVTQVYFADVVKDGQISINSTEQSRADELLDHMVKTGKIKAEEVPGIKKRAQELIDSGEEPKIELPPAETNESLFKFKGLSFITNK